jgi:hypothetical protein
MTSTPAPALAGRPITARTLRAVSSVILAHASDCCLLPSAAEGCVLPAPLRWGPVGVLWLAPCSLLLGEKGVCFDAPQLRYDLLRGAVRGVVQQVSVHSGTLLARLLRLLVGTAACYRASQVCVAASRSCPTDGNGLG